MKIYALRCLVVLLIDYCPTFNLAYFFAKTWTDCPLQVELVNFPSGKMVLSVFGGSLGHEPTL